MSGVRASPSTRLAGLAIVCIIGASAAYLAWRYATLPWLLPVHFKRSGAPDGWQFRTPMRVLLPVFVQLALAATLGMVGALLLSRPHGDEDPDALDVKAAAAAAEAVTLIALIWVAFQAYGAWALVSMWTSGVAGLGFLYSYLELTGVAPHGNRRRARARSPGPAGAAAVRCRALALWPALQERVGPGALCSHARWPPLDAQLRPAGYGRASRAHPRSRYCRPDRNSCALPSRAVSIYLSIAYWLNINLVHVWNILNPGGV